MLLAGRTFDRLQRAVRAEQLQPEAHGQAGRNGAHQRVQPRHELLAHREQRPAPPVAQRHAQLVEEHLAARVIGRIDRHDLLELVDDQDDALLRIGFLDLREVGVQRGRGKRLQRRRFCPLRRFFVQAEQQAEQVAVDVRAAGQLLGQLGVDARHGQYQEVLGLEVRDQRGLDQRGLARAGRRVEQHDAVGDELVEQAPLLAAAAVERLALLVGPCADVGVLARIGAHVRGPLPCDVSC